MKVQFTINIDDKLIKSIKAFFKRRSIIITVSLILITTISFVYAQTSTTDWYHFRKGQTIVADELNTNFQTLQSLKAGSKVPVGTILPYLGKELPSDGLWMWCDGSLIPVDDPTYTDFKNLFATGRTPDLRGMVLAGANKYGNLPVDERERNPALLPDSFRLPQYEHKLTTPGVDIHGNPIEISSYGKFTLEAKHLPKHKHPFGAMTPGPAQNLATGDKAPLPLMNTTLETENNIPDPSRPADGPDGFSIVQPTYTVKFIIKARDKTTL